MEEQQQETQQENPIEEAKKLRDELRQEKRELLEVIDRMERVAATKIISGKAEAGQGPEKPKEETPKEYIERIMRDGHV